MVEQRGVGGEALLAHQLLEVEVAALAARCAVLGVPLRRDVAGPLVVRHGFTLLSVRWLRREAARGRASKPPVRYRVAAPVLLALDRLEERLEVALAEAERAVPLDQLEEDRRPVADRLGEDLQQVAVLVAVDQDAALLQLLDRHPDVADAGPQLGVLVVGVRRGEELDAVRAQGVDRGRGCRWWRARGAGRRGRGRTRGTRRSATSSCAIAGSLSGNFTRWLPLATTLLISAE